MRTAPGAADAARKTINADGDAVERIRLAHPLRLQVSADNGLEVELEGKRLGLLSISISASDFLIRSSRSLDSLRDYIESNYISRARIKYYSFLRDNIGDIFLSWMKETFASRPDLTSLAYQLARVRSCLEITLSSNTIQRADINQAYVWALDAETMVFEAVSAFPAESSSRDQVDDPPIPVSLPSEAPSLYSTGRGIRASDFLHQHWKSYMDAGLLYQHHLRRLDPALMRALDNEFVGRRDELKALVPPKSAETAKLLEAVPNPPRSVGARRNVAAALRKSALK